MESSCEEDYTSKSICKLDFFLSVHTAVLNCIEKMVLCLDHCALLTAVLYDFVYDRLIEEKHLLNFL